MKLLIVTQKVDRDDPILGFFHRWIEEFAKHCERIVVICLQCGTYQLPGNVTVLSLGKERYIKQPRIIRRCISILLFYQYIWQKRKDYDAVFVHMNPEYVVLAGLFWRLWRKRILLWYVHPRVNYILYFAHFFTNLVLTVNVASFPFPSLKVVAIGHGIDTDLFSVNTNVMRASSSLLVVGRITPIKYLHTLLAALIVLDSENILFSLTVIGRYDIRFPEYCERIRIMLELLGHRHDITHIDFIMHSELPAYYQAHTALINLTPTGSFDKVILESMACGTPVIASNQVFRSVLPVALLPSERDVHAVTEAIRYMFSLRDEERDAIGMQLRKYVFAHHHLPRLIDRIFASI